MNDGLMQEATYITHCVIRESYITKELLANVNDEKYYETY
jgi:hypothetical protein